MESTINLYYEIGTEVITYQGSGTFILDARITENEGTSADAPQKLDGNPAVTKAFLGFLALLGSNLPVVRPYLVSNNILDNVTGLSEQAKAYVRDNLPKDVKDRAVLVNLANLFTVERFEDSNKVNHEYPIKRFFTAYLATSYFFEKPSETTFEELSQKLGFPEQSANSQVDMSVEAHLEAMAQEAFRIVLEDMRPTVTAPEYVERLKKFEPKGDPKPEAD